MKSKEKQNDAAEKTWLIIYWVCVCVYMHEFRITVDLRKKGAQNDYMSCTY